MTKDNLEQKVGRANSQPGFFREFFTNPHTYYGLAKFFIGYLGGLEIERNPSIWTRDNWYATSYLLISGSIELFIAQFSIAKKTDKKEINENLKYIPLELLLAQYLVNKIIKNKK